MAALLDIVTKGSTDRSVTIRIIDAEDGTPETGVTFSTAGLDLWYRREGGQRVAITEVTQTVNGAHTDGGFVHISDGEYRLDLPDAAFAGGANYVDVGGTVPGMIVIGGRVRLVDLDLETALVAANVVAISGDTTAADNLESYTDGTTPQPVNVTHFGGQAASASGGIPSVNTVQWRGTQPNNLTSGRVDVTVGAMQSDVITAAAIAANAIGAAELADDAAQKIRDAILAAIVESQGSYSVQQALSIMLAVLAGQTTNGGNTILTPNGQATRVAATTNGSNERTAMSLTPSS